MRILTLLFVVAIWLQAQSCSATSARDLRARLTEPAAVVPPPVERVRLPQLVREALACHFNASKYQTLADLAKSTSVCEDYKKPAGLFVTLSRHGKTRACWGSITPKSLDIVKATIFTTEEAITKEYRYPPIRSNEWRLLKPQVTIIRAVEPISSISDQNARLYGLFVQYGEKGAIELPGEVIDARCQLLQCKLKAGIPVNQPCQLYRIRADVYK